MQQLTTRRTPLSVAVARACLVAGVTGMVGMIAAPAMAQQAEAATAPATVTAPPKKEAKEEIQEVKVMATRYSTSLLKTPLAVSAFTQDALDAKGITNLQQLSNEMPNVQFNDNNNSSAVQVTIRGISSDNFTEIGDTSVGLHVAGLFSPRPQGAQALMFDVEQVEILRGPQGTLFGRNSTGGSINIIPSKPEFNAYYGKTALELGSANLRNLSMVQNLGISDRFALRAAYSKLTRDSFLTQLQDFTGYKKNGFDGTPLVDQRYNTKVDPAHAYNNRDQWAGRLMARWQVHKDVEIQQTLERYQNSNAGFTSQRDCAQAAGTRYACKLPEDTIVINVPGMTDMTIDTYRTNVKWKVSDNTTIDYGYVRSIQRRQNLHDDDGGFHPVDVATGTPIITYQLPVTKTSGDPGIYPVIDNMSYIQASKFVSNVHELQLKQQFGNVKYVGGLFWMHETNSIGAGYERNTNGPYAAPAAVFYQQDKREIDSKALFGQADWTFKPTWTATLGMRYTKDVKSDTGGKTYGDYSTAASNQNFFYLGQYNPGIAGVTPGWRPHNGYDLTPAMGILNGPASLAAWGAAANNDHKESWSKMTYRLGLLKQIDPNNMVYSAFSTGYKSGGFRDKTDLCGGRICTDGTSPNYSFLPYGPENVSNLELGYKGNLLDNKLKFSSTLFYQRYTDMQYTGTNYYANVALPVGGCPATNISCNIITGQRTINIGRVNIKGLELEWDYRPWKGARWNGFASYIDASIHDFDNWNDQYACAARLEFNSTSKCPDTYRGPVARWVGIRPVNLEGKTLPRTPRLSFGSTFSHDFMLANGYKVTPRFSVKWQDKIYFDMLNFEDPHVGTFQKAYAKADLALRIALPGDDIAFEAYVRNLTDTRAKTGGFQATTGVMAASYIDPRVFGMRVTLNY
ncbi:TonB-dependent receptor [Undibacterium sp. TC4M20W]|uniref:TonB-dependent receptor n=1 Tax=Undibacterium sp. TC4M20W TaxID=3413052 RepID=UPI003BF1DA05